MHGTVIENLMERLWQTITPLEINKGIKERMIAYVYEDVCRLNSVLILLEEPIISESNGNGLRLQLGKRDYLFDNEGNCVEIGVLLLIDVNIEEIEKLPKIKIRVKPTTINFKKNPEIYQEIINLRNQGEDMHYVFKKVAENYNLSPLHLQYCYEKIEKTKNLISG